MPGMGEAGATDFDAAFSQFSNVEGAPVPNQIPDQPPAGDAGAAGGNTGDAGAGAAAPAAGAGDGSPAGGEQGGSPAPAEGAPAGTPAAATPPAAAGTPAPTEPVPAGGDQPPAPVSPDLAQQFKDLIASLAPKQETPAAAPGTPATPAGEPETPLYTTEEQRLLTDYVANWPDVAQAEALRRRGEYAQLMNYVFNEVAKFIAPTLEQVRTLTNEAHLQQLRGAVPDYSETLEQQVAAWVDTQPKYLQAAYQHVMQNGTSDEVADLIGRFKASTGVAPAPAPAAPAAAAPVPAPATPAAPPKATELSRAAKQAAAALAPVGSERTQVTAGQDPGDFDSAFARFAASVMDT